MNSILNTFNFPVNPLGRVIIIRIALIFINLYFLLEGFMRGTQNQLNSSELSISINIDCKRRLRIQLIQFNYNEKQ